MRAAITLLWCWMLGHDSGPVNGADRPNWDIKSHRCVRCGTFFYAAISRRVS